MNKSPITPDENRIEELLMKIQPVPSEAFYQKMKQATWRTGGQQVVRNVRLKIALAAVALAIVSALFVTPQGRAWAQEVVQFFRRVSSTSIPLSEEERQDMFFTPEPYDLPLAKVLVPTLSPELAGLPECQSPQDAQSYACQITYAESKLGFDLKELPAQPEDWEFEALYLDAVSKEAFISYKLDISYNSYSQFTLRQSLGDKPSTFISPLEVVPEDQVKVVNIGSHQGEYVKGSFGITNDESKLIWNASDDRQRLAWSDGARWYLIELFANTTGAQSIGREALIRIAAGLVDKPVKAVQSLDPDFLYSISDAEKLSGLDLKAPTLLPLGAEFSSAQFLSSSQKVLLRYGMNDEFVVHEWKGTPTNFHTPSPESNLDYDIVDIDGRNGFYAFSSGPSPYWFLWWSEGDINYQIYYYQYRAPDGGLLNKEKMIAIAESISDINAVRGESFKPYEYVAVYEQSLGFDVQEFPVTPPGWSFTQVSAYAHPNCITISYTAEKESGWLYSRQCSSDMSKYFDLYHIPRRAIERVKIGDHNGQYVVGSIEYGDSGKPVWNPNLPFRRLIWQEDGFWHEITLKGDSVVLYDKEDLISYAESLR